MIELESVCGLIPRIGKCEGYPIDMYGQIWRYICGAMTEFMVDRVFGSDHVNVAIAICQTFVAYTKAERHGIKPPRVLSIR